MIQRMYHEIEIVAEDGINLSELSNIILFIKQKNLELSLPVVVQEDGTGIVTVSKEDAMKLEAGSCKLQIVYEDSLGNPWYTDIGNCDVYTLINSEGYGHE